MEKETRFRLEALERFTFSDFDKLENIVRYNNYHDEKGKLYTNDVFECTDIEIVKYLLNIKKNPAKRAVVKLLEIK